MVKGIKIDLKQTSLVAGAVTASALGLNWLFATVLKQAVQPLFSAVPAVSPITSTLGEKLLGLVSGILPLQEVMGFGIIATFISAFLIVMLGEAMIDWMKLPILPSVLGFNGRMSRLASVIFYGTIPVYLLLVGLIAPTLMTVIGVLVYAGVVAVLSVVIAGLLKLKI